MKIITLFLAILLGFTARAQQYDVHGSLADTSGKAVANAAISLLETADSTLAFFGISNAAGGFGIKAVKSGTYLLQVAAMGYRTYYKPVQIPAANNDLGYVVLREISKTLAEVEVKGQRIPVLLKGDTVEYNAGAFKVKQDAVVEDLLRKLPGVQVDKAGNVKAQGKDVQKVLVDGKEFFGDDPKMATKNLPADAIDKVQVFGNKSAQTQFTGIDDGTRDQTINLQLKDGKRKGYFGNVEAGGGTDERYKLNAKLYRFQPKRQFAALGMLNNINQFGFTFQDYLTFQGGLQSLMGGGGGNMRMGDDVPVNFGQPVTGLITSGAAGVNYSSDARAGNRFTVSYLGNGANKRVSQQTITRNFITDNVFTTKEDLDQKSVDAAHRLNFSWRDDIDSSQQVMLRGGASLTNNTSDRNLRSVSDIVDTVRNRLNSIVRNSGNGIDASLSASYLKKMKGAWPVWKLSAAGTSRTSATGTIWDNTRIAYFPTSFTQYDNQYQDNDNSHRTAEAATSITRRLGRGFYAEPGLKAGIDAEGLTRRQGMLPAGEETDSLSVKFSRNYAWLRPGVSFRHNTAKRQVSIGLEAESGQLEPEQGDAAIRSRRYHYFIPSLFYQNSYARGVQFNLSYNTDINAPSALQMLPVTNFLNPLQRITGNPFLAPEYRHIFQASWLRFDQFSGTSLHINARGAYTANKITLSRNVAPDLSEDLSYSNVRSDYTATAGAEYNTPIRRTGLSLTVSFEERYSRSLNPVNGALNKNTTFNHNGRLSVSNTKRKYWDIEGGIEADITDARASLYADRRSRFYHYNAYGQLGYKPSDRFNVSVSATFDQYNASTFPGSVTVPLLTASASYYFLKYCRGTLTLEAFDLLNRNTSVERISQLNYLLERRTNIIGQYFLLSFKYRLSKTGDKNALSVEVKR